MKRSFIILIVALWITGWMTFTSVAVDPVAFAFLALAIWALNDPNRFAALAWPSKSLMVLSNVSLTLMCCTALISSLDPSPAVFAIAAIWLLGAFAYFKLLINAASDDSSAPVRVYFFAGVLALLSVWSWGSALALYSHRGVDLEDRPACILKPNELAYSEHFSSVWDMRMSSFASTWDTVTGDFLLFHAVLLIPGEDPAHYNWSKRYLRFEPIDPANQDAFLPTHCP